MASIAGNVVSPVVSFILAPLAEQVSYVVNVGGKVKDLEEKMEELKRRFGDVKIIVEDVERDPTQGRTEEVEGWLNKVTGMETQVSAIKAEFEQRCKCFGRYSGDIYNSYKIGRKAIKKLIEVEALYENLGKATSSLTRPLPSPLGQEMPGTSNSLAIDSNLDKVLGYLADGVGIVGITGMGGVGKTTLLKSINNNLVCSASEKGMHFHHVIWVVISKDGSALKRLQNVIAAQLKIMLNDDDDIASSTKIYNFLKNKMFVLLLDDVWERLDLDSIGIPDQGRMVVFTTRSEDVCGQMEARKKIKVECLKPDDAWHLFKEKVGGDEVINGNPGIERLARQIVDECKGLPLALITIGRAMSPKMTTGEWEYALTLLKRSKLVDAIPDAKKLIHSLKFSYDSLVDDITRECFLICALFPENEDITTNELIECFLGHGVIESENFSDIGEMYNCGQTLIGNLKSACLLESSNKGDKYVKMHDIIRDMALWIACDCGENNNKWIVRAGLWSEEPLKGVNNLELVNRISLMKNRMHTIPEPKKGCPNLSTLMIQDNYLLRGLPEKFFHNFPSLTYLDMSKTSLKTLPDEMTMLVQLKYLNLSETRIELLSLNLRALTKLKYLILRYCYYLKHIPQGLISSLPILQVLDIYGGVFIVSSDELQMESTRLKIEQVKPDLDNSNTKIDELKILKGTIKALGIRMKLPELSVLHEYLDPTTILKLEIVGYSMSKVRDRLLVGKNIKILSLMKFNMRELTLASYGEDGHFPLLVNLELWNLSELTMIIWECPITPETFHVLTFIHIGKCHQLRDLSWIRHVTCLMHLNIEDCGELKEIISSENDGEDCGELKEIISSENDEGQRGEDNVKSAIRFSNLRMIFLKALPAMHNIYIGTIDCPLLEHIYVDECKGLTRLPFNLRPHVTNKKELEICAELEWWNNLQWEDDNIKSYLQPFVIDPMAGL